jgi:acetyl esterase/lipase
LIRSKAAQWKADPERVGIVGFSAGGQVAARLLTDHGQKSYAAIDATDDTSHRPDFALLIYPWNIHDNATGNLLADIDVTSETPATFLVHTHDDASTSLGSVLFYAGLKRHGVGAELHVYQTGGHGYGTRPRPNSEIGTWPDRAAEWLRQRKLAE